MAYRTSFGLLVLSTSLWLMADFFWIYLAFHYNHNFAGYTIWQYIAFQGIYFFTINFYWFLFETTTHELSDNIYNGIIDRWIIKPIDGQFILSLYEFNLPNLANALFGIAIFTFAIFQGGLAVSFGQILISLYAIFLGIISLYSLSFATYCGTFWLGKLGALSGITEEIITSTSKIPTQTYNRYLSIFFYFIVPVALVVTVPANILFFEINIAHLVYFTIFALLSLIFSNWVWKQGLKSYTSANS